MKRLVKSIEKILKNSPQNDPKAVEEFSQVIHSIIGKVVDCYFILDFEGNIKSSSDTIFQFTGYKSSEIIGKNIKSILASDEDNDLARKRIDVYKNGSTPLDTITYKIRHKNGQIVYVETRTIIIEEDGVPTELLAVAKDVTEKFLLEESIQNSEKRYRAIFENMIEAFVLYEVVFDAEGDPADYIIVDSNEAFARTIRMAKEQYLRKSILNIFPEITEGENIRWILFFNEVSKGLKPNLSRFTAKVGDKHYEVIAYMLDEKHLSVLFVDISKQRLNEYNLQVSEERLKLSLEGADEGLWDWDFQTGEIFFSPRYYTMLGYKPDEFIPSYDNWRKLIHPDYIDYAEKELSFKFRPTKSNFEIELPMKTKSGKYRWILSRGKVFEFDKNGKPKRMLGTNTDVHDRKIVEEQLRALSNHLESIREDERKMIAREIHDELGQQLTGLKLYTKSLKMREQDPELRAELDEMSDIISSTIKTVQKITSQLRPDIIDTAGLIAAAEWQCETFQKQSGIACEFNADTVKDLKFSSKVSIEIFRIIQEALTNVSRHSGATKVKIKLDIDSEYFRMQIKDNGIGFDKIKFKDTKSFGLIGMNERALLIGGYLEIKSKRSKGTDIVFELPIKNIEKE